jgi:hypothetical protein
VGGRRRPGGRATHHRRRLDDPDETYGLAKQGARFGHTKVRGYHPLLASAAGTDEVIGTRLRGGNAHTGRGAAGFLTQMFNRVRKAGATGQVVVRADSGFYNRNVTEACRKAGARYSITVKMSPALHKAIDAIPDDAWVPIPYWIGDGAGVAETTYRPFSTQARHGPPHRATGQAHAGQPARPVRHL